ncbi:hypothetical protein ACFX2F_006834 [Malus domestica]
MAPQMLRVGKDFVDSDYLSWGFGIGICFSHLGLAAGLLTYWSHLPSFTSCLRYLFHVVQSLVVCPLPLMGGGSLNHGLSLRSRRIWLIETKNLVYILGAAPPLDVDLSMRLSPGLLLLLSGLWLAFF